MSPVARVLHAVSGATVVSWRDGPRRVASTPAVPRYALEALELHGAVRGTWLSCRRLARCHPWGGMGWDPVPDRKGELMFDAIYEFLAQVLSFFYDIIPNYAVAIALLTISVMVVTTPFTLKGTRSMIQMQRLQPEMKKLQLQYKDDRQKLNEELMAFYKENNLNPLGGCLPLLLQTPIFIFLYHVLRGLTYIPAGADDLRVRSTSTDSSALYQDLHVTDQMTALGVTWR